MLQIDSAAVEWRLVDDEIVALDVRRQVYLAVNATGAKLWSLLVDGATEAALVESLVADHGLPEPDAAADVAAFLAVLRERKLVRPA
jgi:hypothetical protein